MRIRNIKPEFFLDDILASCDPYARLLFIGLWCIADVAGRLEDRPIRIKAAIFPYEQKLDCDRLLEQLKDRGFISRYHVDGKSVIEVTKFRQHQRLGGKEVATVSIFPEKPLFIENSHGGSEWESIEKLSGSNGEAICASQIGAGSAVIKGKEGKGKVLRVEDALVIPPMLSRLPMWEDTWEKFCQHRSTGKSKFTTLAKDMAIKKLATFRDPIGAMENSIVNGWSGLFDPKEERPKVKHWSEETADEAAERIMRGG